MENFNLYNLDKKINMLEKLKEKFNLSIINIDRNISFYKHKDRYFIVFKYDDDDKSFCYELIDLECKNGMLKIKYKESGGGFKSLDSRFCYAMIKNKG